MNDLDSIEKAVNIIREAKVPYALLHCTNVYPTPPELVRL
jgi:N-acetylneuraminate synthase